MWGAGRARTPHIPILFSRLTFFIEVKYLDLELPRFVE